MTSAAAPGFVVAAAESGAGTTAVTNGLVAALAGAGATVAPFTVGPGHVDSGRHAPATGGPARTLDPLLVGARRIAPLYAHGSAGHDVAVVEGVEGLFDGRIEGSYPADAAVAPGSAAHVAGLLGLPVMLVIDVRGYAQTLAPVVRGLATHDPGTRIVGVILNRVDSEPHTAILTAACESAGVPVLGAIPHTETGASVAGHVDLEALRSVAVRPRDVEPWDPAVEISSARGDDGGAGPDDEDEVDGPVTVAVAGGAGFAVAHAEHIELLEAAGARVVTFDPLVDERLPDGAAGLVLSGGVSDIPVAELAANTLLMSAVAAGVSQGMPVHAEGAGLLYLGDAFTGRDGIRHVMCGALPVTGRFASGATLGYHEAVATTDSVLFREGERVTGHESRRMEVAPTDPGAGSGAVAAWAWRDGEGRRVDEGSVSASVHASHMHVHPAGQPASVLRFVDAARVRRRAEGARAGSGGTGAGG